VSLGAEDRECIKIAKMINTKTRWRAMAFDLHNRYITGRKEKQRNVEIDNGKVTKFFPLDKLN